MGEKSVCVRVNLVPFFRSDAGDFYLIQQGIPYENDWDLCSQFIALGSMTLILWCLAYIQLVRIKKLK